MHFESLYKTVIEKDEHKKSREYKRLSPKMKKAVDGIFKVMDDNRVSEKDLMDYFEKEVLAI